MCLFVYLCVCVFVCVWERHVYMRSSFLVQVKRVCVCTSESPSNIPPPPQLPCSHPNFITLTLNSTRQFTGLLMWWWYGCPATPHTPRIAPSHPSHPPCIAPSHPSHPPASHHGAPPPSPQSILTPSARLVGYYGFGPYGAGSSPGLQHPRYTQLFFLLSIFNKN